MIIKAIMVFLLIVAGLLSSWVAIRSYKKDMKMWLKGEDSNDTKK